MYWGATEMEKLYREVTVKTDADVAVPPEVVKVIGPVTDPIGTVVVIEVLVKLETTADVPLKLTLRFPVSNPKPFMVTIVPTGPSVGLKPVI